MAIGVTPEDKFGLGIHSIKTNLPIEIRPVMPNQVTERDTFDAVFSVLNRTEQKRQVNVQIAVKGSTVNQKYRESVSVKPYERKLVSTNIEVGVVENDSSSGFIRFTARAGDGEFADGLVHELQVIPDRNVNFSSTFGTTVESTLSQPVEIPADMRVGTGEMSVAVNSTILEGG